jgi:hypothetical protein
MRAPTQLDLARCRTSFHDQRAGIGGVVIDRRITVTMRQVSMSFTKHIASQGAHGKQARKQSSSHMDRIRVMNLHVSVRHLLKGNTRIGLLTRSRNTCPQRRALILLGAHLRLQLNDGWDLCLLVQVLEIFLMRPNVIHPRRYVLHDAST